VPWFDQPIPKCSAYQIRKTDKNMYGQVVTGNKDSGSCNTIPTLLAEGKIKMTCDAGNDNEVYYVAKLYCDTEKCGGVFEEKKYTPVSQKAPVTPVMSSLSKVAPRAMATATFTA
jgi:hypothetical protein